MGRYDLNDPGEGLVPDRILNHRNRQRERSQNGSWEEFRNRELIEVLLNYAVPRQDMSDLTFRLDNRFGGVMQVLAAPGEQLMEVKGVTPAIARTKNTLVTPHLGASTAESEDNCAEMAVREIRDYLENGNIKNSVNYPACELGVCQAAGRLSICHRNVPNMIASFSSVLGQAGVNITNFTDKGRGDYAYSIIDTDSPITDEVLEALSRAEGVLRARRVK